MHVEYRMHFGLQLQRYRSLKKKKSSKIIEGTERSASNKEIKWRRTLQHQRKRKKKRLEKCYGESERGELLTAVWVQGSN